MLSRASLLLLLLLLLFLLLDRDVASDSYIMSNTQVSKYPLEVSSIAQNSSQYAFVISAIANYSDKCFCFFFN